MNWRNKSDWIEPGHAHIDTSMHHSFAIRLPSSTFTSLLIGLVSIKNQGVRQHRTMLHCLATLPSSLVFICATVVVIFGVNYSSFGAFDHGGCFAWIDSKAVSINKYLYVNYITNAFACHRGTASKHNLARIFMCACVAALVQQWCIKIYMKI